jgi:hypothetical protein
MLCSDFCLQLHAVAVSVFQKAHGCISRMKSRSLMILSESYWHLQRSRPVFMLRLGEFLLRTF